MSKVAFLKEIDFFYVVTIGSIILSLIGIFMTASGFSTGLFSNYYELSEIEGIVQIMALGFIIILNLVSIILRLTKEGTGQKYPR
ncbi:MAG: hypothetical protein ACFFAJ_04930 [Candidatus Hodarchaeota archaeon]